MTDLIPCDLWLWVVQEKVLLQGNQRESKKYEQGMKLSPQCVSEACKNWQLCQTRTTLVEPQLELFEANRIHRILQINLN